MNIPPYWSKGVYETDDDTYHHEFIAWGWSWDSLQQAKDMGFDRARRIYERWVDGSLRNAREYDYLDVPLREEILETIHDNGDLIGLITRNRYGALVLNAAKVCFVDVDYPPPQPKGFLDAIAILFSGARRAKRLNEGREAVEQHVRDWANNHPGRSFRIYRTAAGLRLLFTDRRYDPRSPETLGLLDELGSDRLYRRLTEKQECFRARLTPKPWRCNAARPPAGYPWDSEEAEQKYRAWEHQYEQQCTPFATAVLEEQFGPFPSDDQIARIVQIHDAYTTDDPHARLA